MIPTVKEIGKFITLQHPSEYRISQGFGENRVNFYKELGMKGHNGIDYACPTSSPVYAPSDCEVTNFYYEKPGGGYGTTLRTMSKPFDIRGIIYRLEFVFGHLKDFENVKLKKWFNRGEIMAWSNNTAGLILINGKLVKLSTGPHLHFGPRLVKKTWLKGDSSKYGWKVVDRNNGYLGYLNPEELINKQLNLLKYEGKLVYGGKVQQGKRHYLAKKGQLQWIQNEVEFFIAGFDFKDAISINSNLINILEKTTYKINWSELRVLQAKNLLGFAVENPTQAKKYYNLLFN